MHMKFQIGKNGITDGTISGLGSAFKNRKVIRISVLRSMAPDKNKVKGIADELVEKLGGNFKYTIVGFTIILKKAIKRAT